MTSGNLQFDIPDITSTTNRAEVRQVISILSSRQC